MIKFKVFDVGDIHYEEQLEQFQKEHQNAEFVQITGGYTSYEKIWFKYDDCIERPELNGNQQIILECLKKIYNKNGIKMNISAIFWVLHQNYLEDEFSEESLAYEELPFEEELQVAETFINWFEQEEVE